MDLANHNRIVSFLWRFADDLREGLFVSGKHPGVVLRLGLVRRLDGVLEPTKARVLEAKGHLKAAPIKVQAAALRRAASRTWPDLAGSS